MCATTTSVLQSVYLQNRYCRNLLVIIKIRPRDIQCFVAYIIYLSFLKVLIYLPSSILNELLRGTTLFALLMPTPPQLGLWPHPPQLLFYSSDE